MAMKTLGLALGVGGARGFVHYGVLLELEANGIKPDFIAGGSMGSLIGGVYALNGDLGQVGELVRQYRQSDLYVIDIASALLKSGVSNDKRFIKTMSAATEGKNIEDCKIPFKAVAVDLCSGEEIILERGELWRAIRASCSIPGILPPVEVNGMYLVDGGLLNRVPASIARAMGADVVVAVDALGDFAPGWKPKSFVSVMQRSFAIVDKNIFHARRVEYDLLLTPVHDEVDPMKFNKPHKQLSIEAGRQAVRDNIEKIKTMLGSDMPAKR